jgi:hypothetical protein
VHTIGAKVSRGSPDWKLTVPVGWGVPPVTVAVHTVVSDTPMLAGEHETTMPGAGVEPSSTSTVDDPWLGAMPVSPE